MLRSTAITKINSENVWECNLQKFMCDATCQIILGVIDLNLNHTRKHGFAHPSVLKLYGKRA